MGARGPKVGSKKPANRKIGRPTKRIKWTLAQKLTIINMKQDGKSLSDMMAQFPGRTKSSICTIYSPENIIRIRDAEARGVAPTEVSLHILFKTSHLHTYHTLKYLYNGT